MQVSCEAAAINGLDTTWEGLGSCFKRIRTPQQQPQQVLLLPQVQPTAADVMMGVQDRKTGLSATAVGAPASKSPRTVARDVAAQKAAEVAAKEVVSQ